MQSGANSTEKKAFVEESPTKYRKLGPYSRPIVFALTIGITGLAVIFLYNIVIFGTVLLDNAYYLIMLGSFLALLFLNIPASPGLTEKIPWYDVLLAVLGFGIPFYLALYAYEIIFQAWESAPPSPAMSPTWEWKSKSLTTITKSTRGGSNPGNVMVRFTMSYRRKPTTSNRRANGIKKK